MIRWHRNAVAAARQLGNDWKYLSLSPGGFHFWSSEKFRFEYKPDVSWLYKNRDGKTKVLVWEMESGYPDTKRICGDAVLAAMIKSDNAFCYLSKDEYPKKLGPEIRYDETSDWSNRKIGWKGDLRVSPEIEAFFLVVEERETKVNTRPYIDAIKYKTHLLKGVMTHVCSLPYSSVEEMKRRLREDQTIRNWK